MATYLDHRVPATVTTTDATVTTCGSYTLPDETVVLVMAFVVGRTTGGVAANFIRAVGVQREAAGAAALVCAVDATGWFHSGKDVGATAWDTVDGNLTSQIVTVNSVNVNVIGSYTVT